MLMYRGHGGGARGRHGGGGPVVTGGSSSATTSVLWSDNFAAGDFSYNSGGWGWAHWRNQILSSGVVDTQTNFGSAAAISASVVTGFSRSGNTGNCAKFAFTNNQPGDQAWAELNYVIGTSGLSGLWCRFYIYYPNGLETDSNSQNTGLRGPAFSVGTAGGTSNNNKLYTCYESYSVPAKNPSDVTNGWASGDGGTGCNMVVETWPSWNQGGPNAGQAVAAPLSKLSDGGRTVRHTATNGDWDVDGLYPISQGTWIRNDIGFYMGTSGNSDGYIKHYRNGSLIYSQFTLAAFVTPDSVYTNFTLTNTLKAGYLWGFMDSGIPSSYTVPMNGYISDVVFSTEYLG